VKDKNRVNVKKNQKRVNVDDFEKVVFPSFRHSVLDTESSILKYLWIPAFAGMTVLFTFYESVNVELESRKAKVCERGKSGNDHNVINASNDHNAMNDLNDHNALNALRHFYDIRCVIINNKEVGGL